MEVTLEKSTRETKVEKQEGSERLLRRGQAPGQATTSSRPLLALANHHHHRVLLPSSPSACLPALAVGIAPSIPLDHPRSPI